jgi:hypothetical protein
MFIKYFIPEDGDEQAHPNVFRLEASQPTLSEIKKVKTTPAKKRFRGTTMVYRKIFSYSGLPRARNLPLSLLEECWLAHCMVGRYRR